MMILNLINVIAIAIGIGTSAKSTNLDVEKKTRKNEVEIIEAPINIQNIEYDKIGADYTYYENGYDKTLSKYYLHTENETYYYQSEYLAITNTTYTNYMDSRNSSYGIAEIIGIYTIQNTYSNTINFSIQSVIDLGVSPGTQTNTNVNRILKTTEDSSPYIDLTLNQSNFQIVEGYVNRATMLVDTNTQTDANNTSIYQQLGNQELAVQQTITYIFVLYRSMYNTNYATTERVEPYRFNLHGIAYIPNIEYEVVDIPGLMFTILTLPFSFISQAFNLTIFPGTPYQINFTNLFMTIIAVFILIWLIKHILK